MTGNGRLAAARGGGGGGASTHLGFLIPIFGNYYTPMHAMQPAKQRVFAQLKRAMPLILKKEAGGKHWYKNQLF